MANVEERQRLHCRTRPSCLLAAAWAGWDGFSCIGCDAFIVSDGVALYEELQMLARFGDFVVRTAEVDDV